MMHAIRLAVGMMLGLFVVAPVWADEPTPEQIEFFEKKIRPVLAGTCKKCHSAETRQRGGLVLDSRDQLLKGGDSGPALAPGHPEKSRLYKAVSYVDPDLQMPPRKKLSKEQIADFAKWIKMGAAWPKTDVVAKKINKKGFDLEERAKHWAFQPMIRPSLPVVRDKAWPLSSLDRFVLAKLEAKGLKPNPPADKRTLLRRVYFDLIGLPPTPAEIDAFVKDASPKAFSKVVERLLKSPHYGERWGRHWLDLVRFAETRGHEFDFEIPDAWRYRDYVIRAFNDDVPYDQFVREHIAGDLLPKPRVHPQERFNESLLATGFWWLGEGKHAPVDVKGDQADRLDNQIDVFGKTFLGLTVACARCHDHKFDAITQRDYYSLMGYLQSSRYEQAFVRDSERMQKAIGQLQKLRADIAALPWEKAVDDKKGQAEGKHIVFEDFAAPHFQEWYLSGDAFGSAPSDEDEVILRGKAKKPEFFQVQPHIAHSGLVSDRLRGALRSKTFTITKNFIHYRIAGRGSRIRLILDGFQIIRNPIYGGLEFPVKHGDELRWRAQNVSMWKGHRAYIEVLDEGNGWIAVDQVAFADEGRPPALPNAPSLKRLSLANKNNINLRKMWTEYRRLEGQIPNPHRILAMTEGSPVDEFLHIRGSHKNLGKPVPRRFLEVFVSNKAAPGTEDGSGRLELAEKIVAADNPLTARVLVNRLWKHHFGEGIVKSVDNFGVLGHRPTHPKLLDWLATEFVRRKWSIKDMHRLMVLSRTYQMSSRPQMAAKSIDPNNELLHRMPVKRLEGEIIRDALLAISGRLDKRMFGPGIMPHLTPHMAGRGRPRSSGPLDGNGRRSIYINVRRNFLTPFFLVFDYPVPFSTMGRRSVSNVPAQALTMMNNPFVLQQTKLWSQTVLAAKHESDTERLQAMYVKALGRPADQREVRQMLAFLAQQRRLYDKNAEARVWHDLCHVVVNLKEFIYVH